jgi:hypothetical protein
MTQLHGINYFIIFVGINFNSLTTLSTTNATGLDPGSRPGRLGEKPVTNHLSYGTASLLCNEELLGLACIGEWKI